MVDAEKARRLTQTLLDSVADLRRYRGSVTKEQLATDRDVQHMVLHALYVAIQSAVDLAMHIAADSGLAQSESYRAVFRTLERAGIIDAALASRLEGWAGLRNVVAHMYATIDYARVHQALAELEDLERFAVAARARIQQDRE